MKSFLYYVTVLGLLVFSSYERAHAYTITDDLENIGPDGSDVTSRDFGDITLTIINSGGAVMHAMTYDRSAPYGFEGANGVRNIPLNPARVSGSRFISTGPSVNFDNAQPIIFDFSEPVVGFGLTTIDLLENGVPNSHYVTLQAYDANNQIIAEHTRSGPQGASGLDLDWYVASDSEDIVQVRLLSNITQGAGYGLDDLMVETTPPVPEVHDSATDRFAYVTNHGSNTVSVIDSTTNSVVADVPVGLNPTGIALTPDGAFAYVANYGSGSVSVIATATDTVVATVPVGENPWGVAITPDGASVYVTNFTSNTVSVIGTATNTVTATVPVGQTPLGVAITPDGAYVYVANHNSHTVSVIATSTNTVATTIPTSLHPWGVAITPDGAQVHVSLSYGGYLNVIDTGSNSVTTELRWSGYCQNLGIDITQDGSLAYVAAACERSGGYGNAFTYSTDLSTFVDSIDVGWIGSHPVGINISPDGSFVFIADYGFNHVTAISTVTNSVLATIPVGANPYWVAFGSATTTPLFPSDGCLKTFSSYEFPISPNTQESQTVRLVNTCAGARTATLDIINPYSGISIGPEHDEPMTVAGGATEMVPILIDGGTATAGLYDGILLKTVVDDGSIFYSDITLHVTEDTVDLPDLTLGSQDIAHSRGDVGDPDTLTATVGNHGTATASNVRVDFYEFSTLLGSAVIDSIPVGGTGNAILDLPALSEGDHLIRIVVDPAGVIEEFEEANNEASRIVRPSATPGPTAGNILVTSSLPSTLYSDRLFSLTGRAAYDITVDGVRYTDYVVKGGAVGITMRAGDGSEWVYGGIHTDINGNFSKALLAPSAPGTYRLFVTVTDNTFVGTREHVFTVEEAPATPPRPPLPPISPSSGGTGEWTYVPVAGSWTWSWTTLPTSGPTPVSDLRVVSEDIHFSTDNPDAEEEITIFAEIHYWANSTAQVAENIPVNIYATYPGTERVLIGQTLIPSLSLAAPENGSRFIYGTWKNQRDGIHIIEVEIDPGWVEENMLNNAATRAIIVGELAPNQGAVSGEVRDDWGGVGNVIIRLYDADGSEIASTVTDEAGFYLAESIPAGEVTVSIDTPSGYLTDAQTKTESVTANSVTTVDFTLTEEIINDQSPVADPGGPYSESVGIPVSFDGSGSYDPDGGVITAYEWDFGDGATASGVSPSHAYGVVGTYTVSLRVTDDEGTRSEPATLTVTVIDTTPPTLTVPTEIIEEATGPDGAAVTYSASAEDGVDGALTPTCVPAPGSTFPLGATLVTCTANDAAGNSASASFNVTVVDTTPPVVMAPGDVTLEATGAQTLVEIGTATATDAVGVVSLSSDAPATYPVGVTTVTWSAMDASGNQGTAVQTVTVTDTTPPTLTVPEGIIEETTNPEGAVVNYNTSASDTVVGVLTATCTPAPGSTFPLGTTLVTCTATDSAGNSANESFNVLVHQPPVADPNGPYLVAIGESVALDGSASYDPDGEPLTETWSAESGTLTGNLYTAVMVPGIYVVTLVVNDGLADSEPVSSTVVVYDPQGGFVTGGGWIDSESGWCRLDELCDSAVGKANFGFVSKYKKDAAVPTGETEFNFQAGGFNFHSGAYDWLVVNQDGTNAQYKGTGTINADPAPNNQPYKFMLWATDQNPDDTFRIKIWHEDDDGNETVVYDNGFDQALGGGSIIVHTR